uniref:Uncharacterized protein n=1 Tax=Arion vulgaris TaxID=1028688 RepID=A0A0B7BE54_9EUPU
MNNAHVEPEPILQDFPAYNDRLSRTKVSASTWKRSQTSQQMVTMYLFHQLSAS